MITFSPHASGSAGNLYTVTDGTTRLLFECGVSWKRIQSALRFRVSEVAGCLLSHSHGDHAAASRDVMRAGIDLYTSRGTAEALGLTGHRLQIIKALEQFTVGTWSVLPFDTRHDDAEPLGFLLVNGQGERMLLVTDTAYLPYRFNALSVIAIECNHSIDLLRDAVASGGIPLAHKNRVMRSHMSVERLTEMLLANDLSQVQEIHLLHLSAQNSDAEGFKLAVQRVTGKPVFVAAERG